MVVSVDVRLEAEGISTVKRMWTSVFTFWEFMPTRFCLAFMKISEMSLMRPGRSVATTKTSAGKTPSPPLPQLTSMRRPWSCSDMLRMFGQSARWIVTPRPRVT